MWSLRRVVMDEVKYQELVEAAKHAEHNGGRVSVAHKDLMELLWAWKIVQIPVKEVEKFFLPVITNTEVSAEDLDADAAEKKAVDDTSKLPEPTVQ